MLANMGRGPETGRVVALEHREASWPDGQVAPYMVELNEGGGVYVPADEDALAVLQCGRCVAAQVDALVQRLRVEANTLGRRSGGSRSACTTST